MRRSDLRDAGSPGTSNYREPKRGRRTARGRREQHQRSMLRTAVRLAKAVRACDHRGCQVPKLLRLLATQRTAGTVDKATQTHQQESYQSHASAQRPEEGPQEDAVSIPSYDGALPLASILSEEAHSEEEQAFNTVVELAVWEHTVAYTLDHYDHEGPEQALDTAAAAPQVRDLHVQEVLEEPVSTQPPPEPFVWTQPSLMRTASDERQARTTSAPSTPDPGCMLAYANLLQEAEDELARDGTTQARFPGIWATVVGTNMVEAIYDAFEIDRLMDHQFEAVYETTAALARCTHVESAALQQRHSSLSTGTIIQIQGRAQNTVDELESRYGKPVPSRSSLRQKRLRGAA